MTARKVTYAAVEKAFDNAFATLDQAVKDDPSDGNYTDLAALMRVQSAKAGELKRSLVSEVPAGVQTEGQKYKMSQPIKTMRSYSTDKLLQDLLLHQSAGVGFVEMIRTLINEDVLKLAWSWTNVRKYANEVRLPLVIAPFEIADDDDKCHVGELKTTGSAQFSPVKGAPS
jgi:hypothetical protein